ncbi:MAG: acyltransferase [Candidatus Hydrogenedentes bacterium]|nr:acyltransferase [Candidatus Hydrogenedentota bacterium]
MNIWSQAKDLAAQTPTDRNRYVDFLRAISILVVITGHWLIAAPHYHDGSLTLSDLLVFQPNAQWLTWLFQVMPIFFIVGGYANAVSLESARKREVGYADWLAGRLTRLVTPLLALFLGWALLAAILYVSGVSGVVIGGASRAALIPTWFLAIYIMVVVLAPATYSAWRRWGFASFWAFAAAGALVDIAFFAADIRWMGWTNYFWIWLAVHHLGYAWRDGRVGGPAQLMTCSALGLLALLLLVFKGPYPLAMVGSPDEDLSNSLPPKITLLALSVVQFGLLLAIERPMRRLLSGPRVWAATVLINSMIMTVYLWHLTVMVIIVSLAYLAGGLGLGLEPGSPGWWLSRPIWIALLYAALMPVALLMAPLERRARATDAVAPPAARLVGGAILICLGVALLSFFGFGSAPVPGLGVAAFLMVVAGSAISGLLPGFR